MVLTYAQMKALDNLLCKALFETPDQEYDEARNLILGLLNDMDAAKGSGAYKFNIRVTPEE
jgi:hypothetical protein